MADKAGRRIAQLRMQIQMDPSMAAQIAQERQNRLTTRLKRYAQEGASDDELMALHYETMRPAPEASQAQRINERIDHLYAQGQTERAAKYDQMMERFYDNTEHRLDLVGEEGVPGLSRHLGVDGESDPASLMRSAYDQYRHGHMRQDELMEALRSITEVSGATDVVPDVLMDAARQFSDARSAHIRTLLGK